MLSACNSEKAAVRALGYNQVSWDNLSGQEDQPWSAFKTWVLLTEHEKAAATLLGYTQTTWDNKSGSEPQPASALKRWSDLIGCGNGEHPSIPPLRPSMMAHLPRYWRKSMILLRDHRCHTILITQSPNHATCLQIHSRIKLFA